MKCANISNFLSINHAYRYTSTLFSRNQLSPHCRHSHLLALLCASCVARFALPAIVQFSANLPIPQPTARLFVFDMALISADRSTRSNANSCENSHRHHRWPDVSCVTPFDEMSRYFGPMTHFNIDSNCSFRFTCEMRDDGNGKSKSKSKRNPNKTKRNETKTMLANLLFSFTSVRSHSHPFYFYSIIVPCVQIT